MTISRNFKKRVKTGEFKPVGDLTLRRCSRLINDHKLIFEIEEHYVQNTGITPENFWYALVDYLPHNRELLDAVKGYFHPRFEGQG